jgi:hypothetical protein
MAPLDAGDGKFLRQDLKVMARWVLLNESFFITFPHNFGLFSL